MTIPTYLLWNRINQWFFLKNIILDFFLFHYSVNSYNIKKKILTTSLYYCDFPLHKDKQRHAFIKSKHLKDRECKKDN